MGFKTHETGCGAVGQFIATQIAVDVLVVDVVLPDMNGLQLIKRVRGLAPEAVIRRHGAGGWFVGSDGRARAARRR